MSLKISRNILDNFYLRNFLILAILISTYLNAWIESGSLQINDFAKAYMYASLAYMKLMFHNVILYKEFFKKKRYFLYFVFLVIMLYVYVYLFDVITYLFTQTVTHRGFDIDTLLDYWANYIDCLIALGVYLAFIYSKERVRLLKSENEKKELELKQLNAQLNPHFLFNALNNIYSHLLQDEANNGRELILKLSELMSYVLDSSKKDKVSIISEIQFIENYIAFENERLGYRCDIEYGKDVKDASGNTIPLLLFTFIENAFKHGTNMIQRSTVIIRLYVDTYIIRLYVSNYAFGNALRSTKIGLGNARKRLELLCPEQYKLDIDTSDNKYTITLEINKML